MKALRNSAESTVVCSARRRYAILQTCQQVRSDRVRKVIAQDEAYQLTQSSRFHIIHALAQPYFLKTQSFGHNSLKQVATEYSSDPVANFLTVYCAFI